MDLFQKQFYELPDRDGCVKATPWWSNGDVTFLLVAPDGINLEIVVARDIDGDGIFHQAESYWLNDDGELTLQFLQNLFKGCLVYR